MFLLSNLPYTDPFLAPWLVDVVRHSVVQTLCDPMDCNTPGFPVLHQLPEFA